ncbi:uncharacterized protein LOC143225813 isoform X2 [Tachypleus tridentatus]|uniref:uncharacterized protein LOC143225813 isoform X2 n=1 Tax=Tachypleus tridentatus TaxID=6853 RepID=UPI003FD10950
MENFREKVIRLKNIVTNNKLCFILCNIIIMTFAVVQFLTALAIRKEHLELKSSEHLTVSHINVGIVIAVVASAFSFLLSICGMYVTKYTKHMLSYVLLLIPVVADITLCVFVWKYSTGEMVRIFTTKVMLQEIQHYYTSTSATRAIDSIQTKFKCCGPISTEDYTQNNLSLPYSCIDNTKGRYYEKSCGAELSRYLTDKSNMLGWIGIVLIAFQTLM